MYELALTATLSHVVCQRAADEGARFPFLARYGAAAGPIANVVDGDMSLVTPVHCTEQFGKRGYVDHQQSAVPLRFRKLPMAPGMRMSTGLSNAATFRQRDK